MQTAIALCALACASIAAAAANPATTPRAELPRRDTDPALLGWVSTSGASAFSDQQTCDFPATLSVSGSFAQCCAASSACNIWTTCSAGAVVGASTSVFCDTGICNTGVIVPSIGASKGTSYLGCWASSLGDAPFTLVQDIGSASVAAPTASATSGGSGSASATGSRTSAAETGTGSATAAASSGSSVATAKSTGAAVRDAAAPLTGIFGLVAGFLALL